MNLTEEAWEIFKKSIADYHVSDEVNTPENNPYLKDTLEYLLYSKNWIDTVQWHLEDIIRDENIQADEALKIKRRIDRSNQKRTDLVEYIDDYFFNKYRHVSISSNAKLNTESPAWAIDRLSILALKIYHMDLETHRESASDKHRMRCLEKLNILKEQHIDLSTSIEQLLSDIDSGLVQMKTYKQMKMYNDETLNPVLYQKKNSDEK